jgi:hypothetical protein
MVVLPGALVTHTGEQAERHNDMAYDPFNPDPNSFLSGGSIAAKFPRDGYTVEGTVLSFRMAQRTDINSGEPLFWENKKPTESSKLKFEASKNQPAMQLLLEIQGEPTGETWETNRYIRKEVPDDDGVRTMYVTGGLQKALSKALKDAGGAQVEKGAYVKVTKTGETRIPGSDFFAFNYVAQWTPARDNPKAGSAEAGDFLTQPPEDDPFS